MTRQDLFERGMVILSFDTEQVWGHADYFNEAQFLERYPGAFEAHDKLLDRLCTADIPATWFMVGGLALRGSQGARDARMAGLPAAWTSTVPAGSERTAPGWYRHSFVKRLREAQPHQEIGIHGGLIHLIDANNPTGRIWGGVLISVGVLITLHEFGYIRYGFGQLWPLFLIAAGVLLAWQANEVREGRRTFSFPRVINPGGGGGLLSSVAVFGGIERRIEGTIVEGGSLVAFFGGFKIDLSRAEMEGDRTIIDATAIFGGGEIIVPEWWKVSVEGLGIFGGYVDKTRHVPRPDRPVKTVVIRGAAVFGGIEVKSW